MYKYGRVDIRSLQQFLGHKSIATAEHHGFLNIMESYESHVN